LIDNRLYRFVSWALHGRKNKLSQSSENARMHRGSSPLTRGARGVYLQVADSLIFVLFTFYLPFYRLLLTPALIV